MHANQAVVFLVLLLGLASGEEQAPRSKLTTIPEALAQRQDRSTVSTAFPKRETPILTKFPESWSERQEVQRVVPTQQEEVQRVAPTQQEEIQRVVPSQQEEIQRVLPTHHQQEEDYLDEDWNDLDWMEEEDGQPLRAYSPAYSKSFNRYSSALKGKVNELRQAAASEKQNTQLRQAAPFEKQKLEKGQTEAEDSAGSRRIIPGRAMEPQYYGFRPYGGFRRYPFGRYWRNPWNDPYGPYYFGGNNWAGRYWY